jgi:hypothetical protein
MLMVALAVLVVCQTGAVKSQITTMSYRGKTNLAFGFTGIK